MSQELLHRADIVDVLQKMGGKTVAQRVTAPTFRDASSLQSLFHGSLQYRSPSSSQAVEGGLAAPSRRAPSLAILDDSVSHNPPYAMLDGTLPENPCCCRCSTAPSRCYPGHKALSSVDKHRASLCLTTSRRRVHNGMVLDDYR